jgi:hypothetical protein
VNTSLESFLRAHEPWPHLRWAFLAPAAYLGDLGDLQILLGMTDGSARRVVLASCAATLRDPRAEATATGANIPSARIRVLLRREIFTVVQIHYQLPDQSREFVEVHPYPLPMSFSRRSSSHRNSGSLTNRRARAVGRPLAHTIGMEPLKTRSRQKVHCICAFTATGSFDGAWVHEDSASAKRLCFAVPPEEGVTAGS